MITNIADHSRSTRLAATSPSTWLAIEKYANVSRPVVAIPAERIRAPLPYDRARAVADCPPASAACRVATERLPETDKQHRPGERPARLHDLAVALQQALERA